VQLLVFKKGRAILVLKKAVPFIVFNKGLCNYVFKKAVSISHLTRAGAIIVFKGRTFIVLKKKAVTL
jgi:hypothetical protein